MKQRQWEEVQESVAMLHRMNTGEKTPLSRVIPAWNEETDKGFFAGCAVVSPGTFKTWWYTTLFDGKTLETKVLYTNFD